jgi:hypothetical protein
MTESPDDPLLEQEQRGEYATVSYSDIVSNFGLMGWTAFGGPQAHVALFETVRELNSSFILHIATTNVNHMRKSDGVRPWGLA